MGQTRKKDVQPAIADVLLRAAADAAAALPTAHASEGKSRRDSVVDRRSGVDRRDVAECTERGAAAEEGESGGLNTNLERRRGPGRRRTDFMKCADEGEMTPEQFLFIMAIDAFKRVNRKTFPTWTDVLEVIRKLGYRKTMASELTLGGNVEDWTEAANAPAGVFKPAAEQE
jgi:hypothetical protein